jgi:hypothetical protein
MEQMWLGWEVPAMLCVSDEKPSSTARVHTPWLQVLPTNDSCMLGGLLVPIFEDQCLLLLPIPGDRHPSL